MSQSSAQIDVRKIEVRDKHNRIFETLDSLKIGQSLEIINDHDPKPLRYQLDAEHAGGFSWKYVEEGPEVWRVIITKNT